MTIYLSQNIRKFILIIFTIVVPLILGLWNPVLANDIVPGSDMLNMGRSLESLALGGSSSGLEMKGGNFAVNPALSSTILQQMMIANIGYGTELINYVNLGYLHPTEYGIFGGYVGNFINHNSDDFFFTLGPVFSKEISRLISIGIMILFDYYKSGTPVPSNDIQSWGINASLASSFSPDWDYQKSIFTLREFIASIQIDQLGLLPYIKFGNKTYYAKTADMFKFGTGFTFIQADFPKNKGAWKVRFNYDIGLTYPLDFGYTVGLKNIFLFDGKFKELSLMLGHFRDPTLDNPFPLSGGLGTVFIFDDIKLELGYAFGLNRRDSIESYHTLGFNISFGKVDNLKPEIFSPFGDEGTLNDVEIE